MRTLYVVPILHDARDTGKNPYTIGNMILTVFTRNYLREMRNRLAEMKIDKIYGDSVEILPEGDYSESEIATGPFANYLLNLCEKISGSRIIPTENRELVKKFKQAYDRKAEYDELKKLCEERDEFIRKRIKETLCDNETGVLFIGINHSLPEFDGNIPVIQLYDRDILLNEAISVIDNRFLAINT